MFQIVIVRGRDVQPLVDAEGKLRVFETSADAALAAKVASELMGVKVQPRPISENSWKMRECRRFDSGEYQHLPGWFPHLPDHFAHLSTAKDGMVSFTEDPLKGAADRQTRIKPGAYVSRYFRNYTGAQVTQYAQMFAAAFEEVHFKLATTAEGIEHVYRQGPRSCMSGSVSDYRSDEHPVHAYAAGDLAVAYIEDRNKSITARTVVWPEKKKYVRIYGDEARLRAALRNAGYSQGDLEGARLLRIISEDDAGYYTAPFLDGCCLTRDDGEFLVIDLKGYISCGGTEGLAQDEGVICSRCSTKVHMAVTFSVYTNRHSYKDWCPDCRGNHTWMCYHTRQYWSNEVTPIVCADGTKCSAFTFTEHGGFQCAGSGLFYASGAIRLYDGTKWNRAWVQAHGFRCAVSGCYFRNEDMSQSRSGVSKAFEHLGLGSQGYAGYDSSDIRPTYTGEVRL